MPNKAYPLDVCVYEDEDDVALLGTGSKEEEEFEEQLREAPPANSLYITACFTCLAVCGMTIVIPTSQQYTESFNATRNVAGLVVGASPFFLTIAQLR